MPKNGIPLKRESIIFHYRPVLRHHRILTFRRCLAERGRSMKMRIRDHRV